MVILGLVFFERIGHAYVDNPYYHTINDTLGLSANSIPSVALVSQAVIATTAAIVYAS